jgi:hypothetical protein
MFGAVESYRTIQSDQALAEKCGQLGAHEAKMIILATALTPTRSNQLSPEGKQAQA